MSGSGIWTLSQSVRLPACMISWKVSRSKSGGLKYWSIKGWGIRHSIYLDLVATTYNMKRIMGL
jgi:hypothetical protein